ncbi:MAG: O-methyltransferase [Muribaculaceae bacterium]|nr:O-methyltransferase [Muribaculaceae bacterium]
MTIEEYIESHISKEPSHLRRLDRISHLRMVHGRMCSGHWQGRLLKMLTEMISPRNILELGTFTGYATLCMAEGAPDDARIDTIEVFDENEDFLRSVFEDYPGGEKVNLIMGDASEIMKSMDDECYDLIFIDADKRAYPDYLTEARRILRPGGFIIADNTLWDGHVIETDRNDPQTAGVKLFNDLVAGDDTLEKVIIPLRDGLTLIRKKE